MYGLIEYEKDLETARKNGCEIAVIGRSTLGRAIHMITKGSDTEYTVLIHGGMHAREWLTTPLLMRLMSEYRGNGRICCIPCVNIDGMLLVNEGIDSITDPEYRAMLLEVNGGKDFSQWKANANCVDLNVNFDANWGKGIGNIRKRNSKGYIGEYPLSEVENQLLAGKTFDLHPRITLSYHTKGEVIYEGYEGKLPYHYLAEEFANYINYDLMESQSSHGGYKDWFVQNTGLLGLTIECGSDDLVHPIGMEHLEELLIRHDGSLELVSSLARRMDNGY